MGASEGPVFPPDASETERSAWLNALMNSRLLIGARPASLERIAGAAHFERKAEREILLRSEDRAEHAYFLITGAARVFQARQGLEYTPKLLMAPSHFGELAILAGLPQHQSSIQALRPSVIARVPSSCLEQVLASDPELCRAWLYSVARQFAVTIDYLKQTVFGGVTARLANVLLAYADAFGRELEEGWWQVGQQFTYAELAQQAACSRRATIKIMNGLTSDSVVRSSEQGWQINKRMLADELLLERLSLRYSLDDNREAPAEEG